MSGTSGNQPVYYYFDYNYIFFGLYSCLCITISLCSKKLHDLNLSGYWVLLASLLTGVCVLIFQWSDVTNIQPSLVDVTNVQSSLVMKAIAGLVFLFVFLYLFLLITLLTEAFNLIFEWSNITVIKLPPVIEAITSFVQLFIIFGGIICLYFLKGTKGDNKYGPDPLQKGNLHIPKLSKKVLLWIIGLPVICLITLSSTIIIKKGFKGGLEEVQKVWKKYM